MDRFAVVVIILLMGLIVAVLFGLIPPVAFPQ
jgi:hypothetical protein